MNLRRLLRSTRFILFLSLIAPVNIYASFIESSMGTAVLNDATSAYYNPAALILLKNPQLITLYTIGNFSSRFTGQTAQIIPKSIQSGSLTTQTNYELPSLYVGIPTASKFTFGFAIISNVINRELEGNSILRYAQSNSNIRGIDFVPAVEYKINKIASVGIGVNISHANFLLLPTSDFPDPNSPDSQSRNECRGNGLGGDIGFLINPNRCTVIGFNYRSAIAYHLTGTSILEGKTRLFSDHYGFTFWTPARKVLSINRLITENLGLIATLQRIDWGIFKQINIHGIATQIELQPIILDGAVPYHFHDTWLLTVGSHYKVTPAWIVRLACTYNQSPESGRFQLSNGDSIIAGMSTSYEISKNIVIDASYAHVFIQNKNIDIMTNRDDVEGSTKGDGDSVSLKLTFNFK